MFIDIKTEAWCYQHLKCHEILWDVIDQFEWQNLVHNGEMQSQKTLEILKESYWWVSARTT